MNEKLGTITGVILAAGYGERMLPLTRLVPKPLLPVLGVPIFEIVARKLLRAGARTIHANLHHLPQAIEEFASRRGLPVVFHREQTILGTGGGIGAMAASIPREDPVLLHNGDTIAGIDFAPALAFHLARRPLITLILAPAGPRANVALSERGEVTAIGGPARGGSLLGYTGMAILSPAALDSFPSGKRAGLVEILNGMIARDPGSVAGWNASSGGAPLAWGECGSPAGYLEIHRRILIEKTLFDPLVEPPAAPVHRGEETIVEEGTRLEGFCEIGRRARIETGASVENCVLLERARVGAGERRRGEIIFPGGSLRGDDRP